MEENQVRLPNRPRSDQQPATGMLSTGARKIIGGLACSIIATAIWNIAPIKKAVLYACSVVIHVGGDPLAGKDGLIEKVEKKLDKVIDKVPPERPHLGMPPMLPRLGKSPEEIEADRKRKLDKWRAEADAIGLKWGDDWEVEKFEVEVPKEKQRVKDAEERKLLLAQARDIKLVVDDDWDNKTLKEEIKEETAFQKADSDYQDALRRWRDATATWQWNRDHGINARCPTCRHGTRIKPTAAKLQRICARCGTVYAGFTALANFTAPAAPVEPKPPKRKPSLLKRIFG